MRVPVILALAMGVGSCVVISQEPVAPKTDAAQEVVKKPKVEIGRKVLINKIEAVVVGPEGNDIIDTFDVQRPGIDGRVRSLDDRIREREMYQDAKGMKLVDKDQVQKQLKAVQKDNNLTEEGLQQIFKAGGYSYEEGVEQFEVMTAVNQVTGFKVASKMIVSEKDVRAYCNEHPEMLEAEYELAYARFPSYTASSASELKQKLSQKKLSVSWDEAFWIKHSEIAPEKKAIYSLQKGQIYVSASQSGYELIKLVDKKDEKPVPIEQRYAEIERALQPSKYQQLFQAYLNELDEKNAVIRL